jgi:hypothetical protein
MASDRDWAKQMAKIDKQLESVSDEAVFPSKTAKTDGVKSSNEAKQKSTSTLGVVLRLTLSVLLGVGMLFWPYESRCGIGLAGYLGAVVVVAGSGLWSAVWAWRHRAGRAHTLSLLLILWGLVLGAMEVLPRVGYAKPDAAHPATWACPG